MKILITSFFVLCASSLAYADSAALAFDTGGSISIKNSDNSTLLSAGSATAGDGCVVEFGYYSTATSGNNFSGTWVAVAGGSSLNTGFSSTSIGDLSGNGAGAGTYANTLVFDSTIANTVVTLPSNGQIMSIRFYNATSVGTSTYYAAASNNTWAWIAPATVQSNMTFSLDDTGVVWQGGFTAYTGNVLAAIPEPATYAALFGAASLGLVFWRKRRKAA